MPIVASMSSMSGRAGFDASTGDAGAAGVATKLAFTARGAALGAGSRSFAGIDAGTACAALSEAAPPATPPGDAAPRDTALPQPAAQSTAQKPQPARMLDLPSSRGKRRPRSNLTDNGARWAQSSKG